MSTEETESLKIQNQLLSNLDTTEQRQHVVGDNITSIIGPEKTRKDSITSRLLAPLSSAPVTDSDTGLTFINKTDYSCNKMSESKALYWALLLNYSFTSPTNLEDFVQHQMLNKYRPTFNKSSVEEVLNAGKSDQESQIRCSVTCSDPYFTVRSDGMCKAPHEALLAIADDSQAAQCPEAIAGLAQILACGLKLEVEAVRNADFKAPSVSIVFDSSLNRSLYVVRLHFDLPQSSSSVFSKKRSDITQNVYSVSLLVKSFLHYRKSQKMCPFKEGDKKNTELDFIASKSLIKFGLERNTNIPQAMEELRDRIVDDLNKTTVCLTRTAYCCKGCPTFLNPNDLLCMDDPIHERDSA
ncbi:hypothetical protein PoB_005719600 [Plakobranchus ocellatus]|uniref:Uncharacterized protein n=1 Tax=Plakobranchus ocellatus TaxID=259542 RepID=A0AAV4CH13_9GAST|nr:hypothetical protein PoB_005719600 [Plakobranchus ocellatus]